MRRKHAPTPQDHVSRIAAQWAHELPDLALSGLPVIARARRVTLLSRKRIEAVFARHGIDTGEFDVIATLRRTGSPYALRPTELFRMMMISSGGLTDRLIRLEERGLIRRRASREDRRSLLVELTEKGRALAEAAFREDMAVEDAIVAALTPAERATLAGLLAKLAASMEEGED